MRMYQFSKFIVKMLINNKIFLKINNKLTIKEEQFIQKQRSLEGENL